MTLRLPVATCMTTKYITLSVSKLYNTGTSMSAHHLRTMAGHWPHHGQHFWSGSRAPRGTAQVTSLATENMWLRQQGHFQMSDLNIKKRKRKKFSLARPEAPSRDVKVGLLYTDCELIRQILSIVWQKSGIGRSHPCLPTTTHCRWYLRKNCELNQGSCYL